MTNIPRNQLPPIKIRQSDSERLGLLAQSIAERSPATAEFLFSELDRATVVPDDDPLTGIVTMQSRLTFRDDATGHEKDVTLVYPKQADIADGRISVSTPIGAALIGLSAGQAISFETPSGELKSLTVLKVGDQA